MATCPTCRTRYGDEHLTCEQDGAQLLPDEAFEHADSDLAPGTPVGEYHIDDKLGEGGFGAVYRAVHPLIGKEVAIKVLNREHSSNPQMVSRFIDEARSVNQIRHRNIIDIFSFGSLPDGRHYYVMEMLEGGTLDRHIQERGRIPVAEALPILREVARALDAAHAHGVAHRDLKPDNIFLVDEGDRGTAVKLLDFGIAKLLMHSSGHKTRTGAPLGTPAYMSPEQCHATKVDHRTDIYSLGVVIHEALTGELPFGGNSMMEVLVKQTTEAPPAMSSRCKELPKELDAPVLKMLEKDPDARPQTIVEAIESLVAAAAAAGIETSGAPLTPTPLRSGGAPRTPRSGPGAVVRTPGALTPKDADELGEAKTVVHGTGRTTLQGAASDGTPSDSRGKVAIAVGGVAVAAVIVAALLWPSGEPDAIPTAASDVASAPAASSAPSSATSSPSLGLPAAVSAAPSAESATVEIEIESVPPNTEVWLGDQRLGVVPGTVRAPRGTDKVKLVLKSAGYKDFEVEVTPKRDLTLPALQLAKVEAPKPAGGKIQPKKASREELEIPNF
jgi:serine/threonine-protein kinase